MSEKLDSGSISDAGNARAEEHMFATRGLEGGVPQRMSEEEYRNQERVKVLQSRIEQLRTEAGKFGMDSPQGQKAFVSMQSAQEELRKLEGGQELL